VSKSIFDGVPVTTTVDDSFLKKMMLQEGLSIVSKCTRCGAPIYGKTFISVDEAPLVKYSCYCHTAEKTLDDLKQTK
jgi:hypothetical protein